MDYRRSPRSAICAGINYYPHLMVNQLINSQSSTWNIPLLKQLFESAEVTRITGITIATGYKPDTCGWMFTKTGRYTVKSGYSVLQDFPDEEVPLVFGPDVRRLQAHAWKVKCTTKLQHFLWQIITGCLSVGARLSSRGIRVDPLCVRCGMGDETINHMLFECPPARQAWALSPIPTPPCFPTGALFSNMAHLFWSLPEADDMMIYPWLLWFIWKARNYKVFSNDDHDPREVLESAITEARAWASAQTVLNQSGSFRQTTPRSRYRVNGVKLMGRGRRQNVVQGLVDCAELVKMVAKPEDWPAFEALLEEVEKCKRKFHVFSLTHIPRTKNTKADKLARSARDQPYDVYYVNSIPPVTLPVP
ncbi:unnamed protein product [Microthlaspi erraticum]|uniref:Reverse transcriptase zinc-binding domain-containing protein n=1 Tax=Microthlaspi erraticum TaxID=1685480 RepID=A0A6D2KYX4_9BRAS|nr:unnamed protein product [Microthlaspi erraticum]CAA7025400.1 unnamed protein product [Microthlaspi erraticum]CAA7036608.1 unnamed protein product [Microthlaspi erraticum]CAA7053036.1 unnamed protein product [Microthlaspi erraticum]